MGWAEPGSYGFIRTLSVANDPHADSKFWHNRIAGPRTRAPALRAGGNFNPVLGLTAYC
jgi:hypothetical protein